MDRFLSILMPARKPGCAFTSGNSAAKKPLRRKELEEAIKSIALADAKAHQCHAIKEMTNLFNNKISN